MDSVPLFGAAHAVHFVVLAQPNPKLKNQKLCHTMLFRKTKEAD
jgi:hypothetical protein